MRLRWINPLAALAVLVSATLAFAQEPTGEPIVIGAVISLTGRDAAFGQEDLAGLNLAVEEANGEGGVHGRPVTLQVFDDHSNPILAAEGVRTLAKQHHPVAIVGSNTSMVTKAAAVAAQSVGVPLVIPEATEPAITSIGDWIHRVCFVDPDMAGGLAAFAHSQLGLRKVAILTEEKHDYTLSFTKYFRERFAELGGEIVFQGTYAAGASGFDDLVRQSADANADAIFVSGFYPEAGAIVATAKRLAVNVAFLGGDGWESGGLFDAAGDGINDKSRVYIASHFSAEARRAKVRGFVDEFQESYGRRPNTSSALGFDAGGVILSALGHAADPSPAGVKAALRDCHYEGVTGYIVMDETRNPTKKVIILQAKPDRRFAYIQAISAAQPAGDATRQ